MKRLLLIGLLLAAVGLPGAAPGAGCSPLDCAASGVAIGNGLLAVRPNGFNGVASILDLASGNVKWRLPAGILVGHTLVEQSAAHEVTWYDAYTGAATGRARFRGTTDTFSLAALSQDGRRAVLMRVAPDTTVAVVSRSGAQSFRLPDREWQVDALSGKTLYLIHYLHRGYEVRRYNLAANVLDPKPLKDPKGSSTIWGQAWERVSSPDGRYLFTLYLGPDGGAMVHQLDLRSAAARCIDLPGSGKFGAATTWALELAPDGKTLWAVSPGYGRVVGIDVASRVVRAAFRFRPQPASGDTPLSSVSAMSPDGTHMAVATGGKLLDVSLRSHTVVEAPQHAVIALGYAPDGTRLWIVGTDERVTALPTD
ncbi:MAG: WD40 repeat domain-containing protein [Gaiellaceae bacterium]